MSNLPCILFTGSWSRRGSPHSHCCPWEGSGNDKTLHADRNQYPPPQRYRFWRGRVFWLPLPLLWGDLVRHPDCILCDCSLHLHCGKVRERRRTPQTHRTRVPTYLLHKTLKLQNCCAVVQDDFWIGFWNSILYLSFYIKVESMWMESAWDRAKSLHSTPQFVVRCGSPKPAR